MDMFLNQHDDTIDDRLRFDRFVYLCMPLHFLSVPLPVIFFVIAGDYASLAATLFTEIFSPDFLTPLDDSDTAFPIEVSDRHSPPLTLCCICKQCMLLGRCVQFIGTPLHAFRI